MGPTTGYHPAVEEYLETILELEESGIPPMRARIVERLGVSAPAVSETVKRLEREGYLVLDERRRLRLTDTGRRYATSIMRRHRLAERLLVDVLHVPWSEVHEEAGRLEHAISPRLEAYLVKLLGDPGTCPHGNPIPGSANLFDPGPLVPLATVTAGAWSPSTSGCGPSKATACCPAASSPSPPWTPTRCGCRLPARTSGSRSRWPRTYM
jgi:DtxR family Mn-dependent transcriptional regulator